MPGSRVGEIERAAVNASAARIHAIAAALGLSTEALLRRAELISQGEPQTDAVRSGVIENFRRLSAVDADLVGQLVARLLQVPR
jgi:hypothetical protein